MKSQWTDEAYVIAERMWKEGKSGLDISIEIQATLKLDISRAAIIRMMGRKVGKRSDGLPRAKMGKPTREVHFRRAKRLSAAAMAPPQKVHGIPVDVVEETKAGIPLTEAKAISCHRVIGDVVRRGVSMVCGAPVTDPSRLFCDDCLRLLKMEPVS